MKKLDLEEILRRSIAAHGTKYKYDRAEYEGIDEKMWIGCSVDGHGYFEQSPYEHTKGQGCPSCGLDSRLKHIKSRIKPFDELVAEAKEVHGDTFYYEPSRSLYKTKRSNFHLFCETHNEHFKVTINNHLKGTGCLKCGHEERAQWRRKDTETFITESKARFPGMFCYEDTEYVYSDEKLSLKCVKHNHKFTISPNCHLQSSLDSGGCTMCANEATGLRCRKTTEQFIKDAKEVHGDKYEYPESEYKTIFEKVKIWCNGCKTSFWQNPSSHTAGRGCPACVVGGYARNKTGWLYILKSSNLVKVGITNSTPQARSYFINKQTGKDFRVYAQWKFEDGNIPLDIETEMLRILNANYTTTTEKFNGFTECFSDLDPSYLKHLIEQRIREISPTNEQHSSTQLLETA